MKKLLAALLAFMMIISLCACSEEQTEEENEELIEVTPERGTVENGFYENKAFAVSFAAPEDWYFLTDDEIAQTMGSTAEQLYGEGVLAKSDYIYDVYCVDMETGTTVSVNYENLGTVGQFTEADEYLETVLTQLLSTGTDSGVASSELSVAEVDGIKVPCLNITLEVSGTTIYESIIVKKIGTWIGTVTMATLDEAELETLSGSVSFS